MRTQLSVRNVANGEVGPNSLEAVNGRQLYNATTSLDRKLTGNINEVAAMAVGTFYRPNLKTMVLISGSFGNNDNMVENIRRNQAVQNIEMAGTVPFF